MIIALLREMFDRVYKFRSLKYGLYVGSEL